MLHLKTHSAHVSAKGLYCFSCRLWLRGDLIRCQFCEKITPRKDWGKKDKCPKCKRSYDPILAQESDD